MRLRALLGGLVAVGAVAFWHRPKGHDQSGIAAIPACAQAGAPALCDAVAGLQHALHSPLLVADTVERRPPPDVPGATNPAVRQDTLAETICRPGYSRSIRPAYAITEPLKRQMMQAQHPGEAFAGYELDHLIPISLGGAPLDAKDLWLQPRQGRANAAEKNALAYVLWRLVCERRVPLGTAQQAIRQDWIAAYATYATPQNLATYHFRHDAAQAD